jgi:diacylglycerol kinase (ATP)
LIAVVINRKSGRGLAKKLISKINAVAHHDETISVIDENSAEKSSTKLSEFICHSQSLPKFEYLQIVAVGGDGLVNLCIQETQKSDSASAALAVYPAGTGNDFANTNNQRELEISRLLKKSSDFEVIDLGVVSKAGSDFKRYFGQVLSTGFDALVNERANSFRIVKGKIKYTIATLMELLKFKPLSYRLVLDGKVVETDAMLVSVANGNCYGGGMQIVPHAKNSDGLLDLMVLRPVSKIELLKVFPKVFKGKHVSHPAVSFFTAKEILIDCEAPETRKVYADGEYFCPLPVEISIKPKALKIAVNNNKR